MISFLLFLCNKGVDNPLFNSIINSWRLFMKADITGNKNTQITVFLLLLILSGIGLIMIFSPYIGSMFMSLVFALIFFPLYKYIDKKFKFKKGIKTAIVFIIFLLVIIIPTVFLLLLLISETPKIIELVNNGELASIIKGLERDIRLNIEIFTGGDREISAFLENFLSEIGNFFNTIISTLFSFITNIVKNTISSLIPFATNIIIFAVVFIILVPNIGNIKTFIKRLSPFKERVTDLFLFRISMVTKSMVLASLTVAIINGFIVGLMFFILGLPFIGLAAVLSMFLGIIPLVGPSFVTLPTAGLLILNGNWFPAIVVLVVHFVVMSNVDFFLRPFFIDQEAKMNPIILGIATIGGLATFGLVGLIYGPLIVILFTTCIEVYLNFVEGREFTDSQIYGSPRKNPVKIPSFLKRNKKSA